jgi:hypothetical protein
VTDTQRTPAVEGLVKRLLEEARGLDRMAWSRMDGGQDCSIASNLATEAADALTAKDAEIAGLKKHQLAARASTPSASADTRERVRQAVAEILANDPVCGGRVCSGTDTAIVEAVLAALTEVRVGENG